MLSMINSRVQPFNHKRTANMRNTLCHFVAVACLLTVAGDCLADGKMYAQLDRVPPTIPFQRALILFRDGRQTLILQSKYDLPQADGPPQMGWVVPLPAEPQLASMSSRAARSLFFYLSFNTRPHVVAFGPLVTIAVALLAIAAVCYWYARLGSTASATTRLIRVSVAMLAFALLVGALLPSLGGVRGINVVESRRVGVYDVRVVRADDAHALIAWLNDNAFAFNDQDLTAFDQYIGRGWCFVVAKLAPNAEQYDTALGVEGLTAPLIMRFASDNPVYPVALTATGGHTTDMLIYVAADTLVACDDRLPLQYAGQFSESMLEPFSEDTEPPDFFDPTELAYPRLTKFRGTMTPQQMATDITFQTTKNPSTYRETVYRW
jgi:hypothetical protein